MTLCQCHYIIFRAFFNLSRLLVSLSSVSMFGRYSNYVVDRADEVITAPKPEDARDYQSPEVYMNRLSSLEEPKDRLKALFTSLVDFQNEPTHEAEMIRHMSIVGTMVGGFFGGLLNSQGAHDRYRRLHNASVFDNQYRGNRHFWDTLLVGVVSKGLKHGVQCFLLTTSVGLIGFGSIAYRNKLYLPDYLVGFGTLGAITRLWLGSRAMLAGAGFGFAIGIFAYGFGKGFELLTGESIAQIRLRNHSQWLVAREARLRRLQTLREEFNNEFRRD